MAIIDVTPEHMDFHRQRLLALQADSQPRWGTLTPVRLMSHLRWMQELALEEGPAPRCYVPGFLTPLFFKAGCEWFTNWPRGKFKAPPAALPDPDGDFEEEREQLLQAMDRFAEALTSSPGRKTLEPLIGYITLRQWARVHGVHHRHHYLQFGLVEE